MKPDRIEIAKIVAVHGIKGQLKIKALTEVAEDFLTLGDLTYQDGSPVPKIKINSENKGALVVRIQGVDYRDQAEKLKGKSLFISADALPEVDEDEFYARDLEGLDVITLDGKPFGKVKTMLDHGAGEFLELKLANGKDAFFAFTLAIFPEISLEEGWIKVVPPLEITSQDEDGQVH